MVRLEGIRRQFGSRVLFEELAWTIPSDARLGLVGPNGAGKTTLLRILAGRERPDEGAVHVPNALRVAYLAQEVETEAPRPVLQVVLSGHPEWGRLREDLAAAATELARVGEGEAGAAAERYAALRDRYDAIDGDRVEARAKTILAGLGVADAEHDRPLTELSGGWRMRVVLARLLLSEPGLLLLDEPTNHLDLEAIEWLEGFLADFRGALVVVSHDRFFLNRIVRGLVELDRGHLATYAGGYDDYVIEKRARRAALEKKAKQQSREIAKAERFVERFRAKNTKAKQVQSKLKALDRVERIELETEGKAVRFGFPAAPRAGDVVVRLSGVEKRFGEKVVARDLGLILRRGDRLALVGPNGTGKSTLLKLLSGRLDPDAGTVELGHNVIARYYAQHQLDALDARATLLEELERGTDPGERPWLRNLLGGFLFRGEDVDKRVGVLSGGEKARLALCKMLVRPSNLLLLDEPTNHLDLRSREVLERALDEYGGSLIVVSHDRYFINRVATSVGHIRAGGLEVHPGGYEDFAAFRARRAAEEAAPVAGPPAADRSRSRSDKRRQAEERNRAYRRRRAHEERLAPLEGEIAELERLLEEADRRQADPEVYRHPERAAEVARTRGEHEARLARAYERWESAARELERNEGGS